MTITPTLIVRTAWLFAGSDLGGERAAAMFADRRPQTE
jgi:hypothetical protein